jgi:transposase-like protein
VQAHLAEVYGTEVSRETVSKITDRILEEMTEWTTRPLERGRFLAVVANHGGW